MGCKKKHVPDTSVCRDVLDGRTAPDSILQLEPNMTTSAPSSEGVLGQATSKRNTSRHASTVRLVDMSCGATILVLSRSLSFYISLSLSLCNRRSTCPWCYLCAIKVATNTSIQVSIYNDNLPQNMRTTTETPK